MLQQITDHCHWCGHQLVMIGGHHGWSSLYTSSKEATTIEMYGFQVMNSMNMISSYESYKYEENENNTSSLLSFRSYVIQDREARAISQDSQALNADV